MQLQIFDLLIIFTYFIFVLLIGVKFSGRAGKSLDEFFLSGRALPWWLAGTSMVATTFAADTPLAVTGLVAKHGIAGNPAEVHGMSGGQENQQDIQDWEARH